MSKTIDIRDLQKDVIEKVRYGNSYRIVTINSTDATLFINGYMNSGINIKLEDISNLIKALEFAHKELLNQIEGD